MAGLVNEVTLEPHVELVLTVLIGPTGLFMMGTFFFIAGLFLPQSLARRGARQFVRERVLRLGVPFVVSAVLIWPVVMTLAYRSAGHPVSYWWGADTPGPAAGLGSALVRGSAVGVLASLRVRTLRDGP